MTVGLDSAAQAFDIAIGNAQPSTPSAKGGDASDFPAEQMFSNIGELEVDEDSPAQGGGDDTPVGGEKKPKQPIIEEGDEDDVDAGEDDQEDDDADAEGGEDGPDAEEEDEDDLVNAIFEVVVDGERAEVNLREALDGYIRQETFHRRLNELATVKDAMRVEGSKLIEDRKKYVGLIEQMEDTIKLLIPNEPNWDELYASDPKGARDLQKKYDGL